MQRGLAFKAYAYAGLSLGCYPMAFVLARDDLKSMLVAFGLAFALASLLAILIFRHSLTQEQKTPRMSVTLGVGVTGLIFLILGQLMFIGTQIYLQLR